MPIGVAIDGQARVDSASQYSFTGRANQPYLIFLESLQGGVRLAVYDSTHGFPTVNHSASAGGPSLEQNPSNTFGGPAEVVYRISVWATPPATTARFRFKVHAIDTRPERVPTSFSFGDTLIGETIDPMYDLDWFHAQGVAGQEIVAVVEPRAPAGSGSVGLSVIDDSTKQLLGSVFADAGAANRLTTGRMRLTGTHDYLFAFGSVTSNMYPRYRGPYRFWTYVIDRAPEHRAAAIPFNTEIGNERIDRAGDVDEFTFVANPGTDFNAFVQGGGRTFQLEVARQGSSTPFAAATSHSSDTALFAHPTNRFRITQAGTYVVRLTGTTPSEVADTGDYRLYLYAIDPRPERVPSAVVPGDTVAGEDIGLPGDVDEFTFTGATGEEFNAFLQAQDGSSETRLQLEVLGPDGTAVRSTRSVGTDTSLLRQPTGRFALPTGGTYRLRVSGVPTYPADLNRGAYRLFLYRVDRKPETLPDTLAFGDSLTGEAIDVPGDVDEFRVVVPDSSGANLVIELAAQPAEGTVLSLQLIDSAGGIAAGTSAYAAGAPGASGRVRLSPGTYTLRVDVSHYQDRAALRSAYRLWLYRFAFTPEVVSDTMAIGDTINGEAIDPPGDEDTFRFYGVRGQHIDVAIQGLGEPSGGGFEAFITLPPDGSFPLSLVVSPTTSVSLDDHRTLRLDLPATGWYRVSVSGASSPEILSERGAYRLALTAADTVPETAGAALVPGDSITTELIDRPGDWDQYTVTAAPGQDLGIVFRSSGSVGYPWVLALDPASRDSLAGNVGQFERLAGPFRVPASGQVAIAVFDRPTVYFRMCYDTACNGVFPYTGAYQFRVIPINRAPENAAAAYTLGDTVRTEAIGAFGDVDEFTSSGVPGETLRPAYRLLANPVPSGARMTLEIVDPGTGAVLAGSGVSLVGTSPAYSSLGSFVVPPSGTYVIRVRSGNSWGYEIGTAPYEFFVSP